nr:hypothetical protein [Lachnospiraceae bacterium]
MEEKYEKIPQEMFEFARKDDYIHDEKFKTKPRSYFQDAFLRFRKNKSSVVAAVIIGLLVLFALVAPLISSYNDHRKVSENIRK